MRPLHDPAGVAELRAGERERGRRLADPRRPVEEERVRVPVAERGRQQPLRLVLLRHVREGIVVMRLSNGSHAISSASPRPARVPSSTTYRSGNAPASCR